MASFVLHLPLWPAPGLKRELSIHTRVFPKAALLARQLDRQGHFSTHPRSHTAPQSAYDLDNLRLSDVPDAVVTADYGLSALVLSGSCVEAGNGMAARQGGCMALRSRSASHGVSRASAIDPPTCHPHHARAVSPSRFVIHTIDRSHLFSPHHARTITPSHMSSTPCTQAATRGSQLTLSREIAGADGGGESDTIVMANMAYFQLKAGPGRCAEVAKAKITARVVGEGGPTRSARWISSTATRLRGSGRPEEGGGRVEESFTSLRMLRPSWCGCQLKTCL
eukprot:365628-Chlamydomonas_euryale.AAC.4